MGNLLMNSFNMKVKHGKQPFGDTCLYKIIKGKFLLNYIYIYIHIYILGVSKKKIF